MGKKTLTSFVREVASELSEEGRYGTSHVYRSTANSLIKFLGMRSLCLDGVTPRLLKAYEDWLRGQKRSWDTVGTYMHTLQAAYNRAVDRGLAPYVPRLFKGVFTGRASQRKGALEVNQVRCLLAEDSSDELPYRLEHSRACLELMLRFQGMPFVDLAHLQKSDLKDGYLVLRRMKTGHPLSILVDERAAELLQRYAPADPSSPYLLDIMPGNLSGKAKFTAYQSCLRQFNEQLKQLAVYRRVTDRVTSYSMRHTWATQSKYCGIPVSVISEGLGHDSVKTTEVYLSRYGESFLDKANKITLDYIFNGIKRPWL